jgi:hypothetical protein
MNRRSFVVGGAAGLATLPQIVRANLTWKGNTPLWDIDGEKVDVQFSYDEDCLGGRIQATLYVPTGSDRNLLVDHTPTDWSVVERSGPGIRVEVVIPGACNGDVGVRLVPRGHASFAADEDHGSYGDLLVVNG